MDRLYFFAKSSLISGALMFHLRPKGQGLVEYALLIVLVAVLVIVILALFGSALGNIFSNVVANI